MRLICLLSLIVSLSGCYQNKTLTQNTLIYCTDSQPTSFNPQISDDIASLDATTHQLFNRLVKVDPNTNEFVPDLAESWEQSDDKLRYRFTLREHVSFHQTDYFTPTRYFNADDVLFSFNRMFDHQHPYHMINNKTVNYFYNHPFTDLLSSINKIDEHTVEFVLSKPDVTLLANLAAHYAVIHSAEYAQQLLAEGHPERIDFKPIGTGPFVFKSFDNNGTIRYQKNKQYWHSISNIENLIFFTNPSATKRYTKLLSGECDAISYPAASQLETISENKQISLNSKSTANISLLAFNTKAEKLGDPRVRQALAKAIDTETILRAVYFQSAMQTDTLLSKQSWALKPRFNEQLFNPEQAKKELNAAQFNFNQSLQILLPDGANVFNPNFHKTAELIQANLLAIGVKSTIISLNDNALQSHLNSGDYDAYLTGINVHINDPDSIFRPLLSCHSTPETGNTSYWCDTMTQDLLDDSLTEGNFAQRIKNYYQIQDIVYQQRPYLPIAHVLRLDAISKSILNVEVNPLTGINFQNAIKQDLN
ncbi:ABC transporter substrate-binding protein [Psychromonas sp. 14N.309.X.WAT.B.A12]|uniref:ABC transporter substrate-binding protein n=1 Tax=unclassified Psychromonas TaxID=2614957 RepID=UPI0025B26EFA|nr:ABC transporter substrate-binding protein [Psychromonas sp. 14N.309.X.WAT.B.A12]MDN2663180.1 ABC transporter substrate-binding protein [Psychromonas sp. 14N.309.X.WAT.B.A12]